MPPRRAFRSVPPSAELVAEEARLSQLLQEQALRREQTELRRQEQRRPLLSELWGSPAYDGFVEDLMLKLVRWPKYADTARLLRDPRRLVRDLVDALGRNTRDGRGRFHTTFTLARAGLRSFLRCPYHAPSQQVNGDVQRGKSTVEALQVLVVKLINDSEVVRDRCFSVLGTQLQPWADDVANKMTRVAAEPLSAAEEAAAAAVEEEEAVAAQGAEDGAVAQVGEASSHLFRVTPLMRPGVTRAAHDEELRRTAAEGGCIVFSRTGRASTG